MAPAMFEDVQSISSMQRSKRPRQHTTLDALLNVTYANSSKLLYRIFILLVTSRYYNVFEVC